MKLNTSHYQCERKCSVRVYTLTLLVSLLTFEASSANAITNWSTPVATVGGGCPIESPDASALYTASPSAGTLDIWVYQRDRVTGAFINRTRLGYPVSDDSAEDFCPTPLPGHRLMFVSTRDNPDDCGGPDMYATRFRAFPQKSYEDAIILGCAPNGPNTSGVEYSPSLITTQHGTFLYFSSNVSGDQDIYVSKQLKDGTFSQGVPVEELNTPAADQMPNVSYDGLTMVFASTRDDGTYGGGFDIFITTRSDLDSPWSPPYNLSWNLSFPSQVQSETRPSFSRDMQRLYYGAGGLVYQSTRE